jgi:hypothetical protein
VSILAWVGRQELTPSSFAGQADKSTNWDRRRRIRNSSSEKEVASLKETQVEIQNGERQLGLSTDDESTEFGSLADFAFSYP